jgi:hypothetical protein
MPHGAPHIDIVALQQDAMLAPASDALPEERVFYGTEGKSGWR